MDETARGEMDDPKIKQSLEEVENYCKDITTGAITKSRDALKSLIGYISSDIVQEALSLATEKNTLALSPHQIFYFYQYPTKLIL